VRSAAKRSVRSSRFVSNDRLILPTDSHSIPILASHGAAGTVAGSFGGFQRSTTGGVICVGRVGALALALGIGTAVALGTAGVACADTGGSNSLSSSEAPSASSPAANRPQVPARRSSSVKSTGVFAQPSGIERTVLGSPAVTPIADAGTVAPVSSAVESVDTSGRLLRGATPDFAEQTARTSVSSGWTRRESRLSPVSVPTGPRTQLANLTPVSALAVSEAQIAARTALVPPSFVGAAVPVVVSSVAPIATAIPPAAVAKARPAAIASGFQKWLGLAPSDAADGLPAAPVDFFTSVLALVSDRLRPGRTPKV
jgi:hypothetical protein